jgi:hypothetical protein
VVLERRAKPWTEELLQPSGRPNRPSRAIRLQWRVIREFNAKLLDIAQTNTMAGLNFAAELSRTKGPTEAFELWSRHVQSHLQRLSDQFQELATLGQRLASSSAEP